MSKTPSELLGEQVKREAMRWTHGFCIVVSAPFVWVALFLLKIDALWLWLPLVLFWFTTYIQFFNEIYKVRWKRAMLDSQSKETNS
jgi:uncharacterized membrane protein